MLGVVIVVVVDRSLSIGFGGVGSKISFLSSITMPVRGNDLPAVLVARGQSRHVPPSTRQDSPVGCP